ncbi:hypothetical protein GGI43DRAFT_39203 [Trichoderma evansii]
MSPRHSIAIVLAAISFASAQDLPHPTRLLTNPVQPPGFSDDPALTTPRPLLIITPPEVIYGDPESTSDYTFTPETTLPYQAELPSETDVPIEATTTTTPPPAVSSTSSSPFATSTSFPPLTPLPTAAITTTSSTTSPTTTTATTTATTAATTAATITDDAEAQVASTLSISPLSPL